MNALRRHPVLAALGALLALVAGLAAVNAFDEELTPEARALFTRPRVPFDQQSGWALLAGFHAPPGEEPRAFAAHVRQVAIQRKRGARMTVAGSALEVRAPAELLCVPQEFDCVRAFAARPQLIDDLAADNAVLLDRYRALLASRGLADVVEVFDYYGAASPHFNTVLRVQQVGLSKVGADLLRGRTDAALAWLEADAAFHRLWLEEAGSILTKMLAVRGLSRDLLVAGQLARSGAALEPAHWAALGRIVQPLTQPQRGVAPVLRIEAALFAEVLDELVADSRKTSLVIEIPRLFSAFLGATLRRNATLNFAYPLFADWNALDAVPTGRLGEAIEAIDSRSRAHLEPGWRWAYNFAGRKFVGGSPGLAEYVYRLRDLEALAQLVRCVLSLHEGGIPRARAGSHVTASAACVDPYESRPFAWDAERGELSYKARSRGQVQRFGGRGDRVTFAAYPPG